MLPGRRRVLKGIGAGLMAGVGGIDWVLGANDLVIGHPAPPIVLHAIDGRNIGTRDLLGQVVVVTFWATWCEPCRQELPLLSRYFERHEQHGLQVIGFSLDDFADLAKVRKMAAGLKFPVGLLGSPWVDGYGRIWRVPVSFVIDRKGLLAYDGWKDGHPQITDELLARVVSPLLGI